jgi:hypothetical protein
VIVDVKKKSFNETVSMIAALVFTLFISLATTVNAQAQDQSQGPMQMEKAQKVAQVLNLNRSNNHNCNQFSKRKSESEGNRARPESIGKRETEKAESRALSNGPTC